jgi:hypothetical protein
MVKRTHHSLHYGQGKSVALNYLERYVFRIAITNNRIIRMDHTHLRWNGFIKCPHL